MSKMKSEIDFTRLCVDVSKMARRRLAGMEGTGEERTTWTWRLVCDVTEGRWDPFRQLEQTPWSDVVAIPCPILTERLRRKCFRTKKDLTIQLKSDLAEMGIKKRGVWALPKTELEKCCVVARQILTHAQIVRHNAVKMLTAWGPILATPGVSKDVLAIVCEYTGNMSDFYDMRRPPAA